MGKRVELVGVITVCDLASRAGIQRAFRVGEIMANWVLAVRVETATDDAPGKPGDEIAFLIHSPSLTLFEHAAKAPGLRYRFELLRDDTPDGTRYSQLKAERIR